MTSDTPGLRITLVSASWLAAAPASGRVVGQDLGWPKPTHVGAPRFSLPMRVSGTAASVLANKARKLVLVSLVKAASIEAKETLRELFEFPLSAGRASDR